jgi:saccharopine dehydrogenase-like NADP-dependent oxidoreductase
VILCQYCGASKGTVSRHTAAATAGITKRALVFGGSGRVGGSTVRALNDRLGSNVNITVVGRAPNNWVNYLRRLNRVENLPSVDSFVSMNCNVESVQLDELISQSDIIINTAGPFQSMKRNIVFETSLKHGKNYIDVCDDIGLSRRLRDNKFQQLAKATNAKAIVSTGIWPGCSSLLSCDVIEAAGGNDNVDEVEFSFFTAGSGTDIN